MKNIYEILKHDTHKLDIIVQDNMIKLGCITCGEQILEIRKDLKYIDFEINDIISVYNTAVEYKYFNVANSIKSFMIKTIKLDCIKRHIKDYLEQTLIDNNNNMIIKLYTDGILRKAVGGVGDIINYLKIADKYEELKQILLNSLNAYTKYEIHDKDFVIANEINRVDNGYFTLVNKEMKAEKEKEFPTATDIYKFKNINDYYELAPDWEDEDDYTNKFKEFEYRHKAGLYDYSNLTNTNLLTILQDVLDCLDSYDYNERYILPGSKALNELHERLGE